MQQELPFLAAGGILCFTPLTLYLFWLATVNRGDRPVVVSGVWDFVALLSGLFGFIFCSGLILTLVSMNADVFHRGGFAELQNAWANAQLTSALTPVAFGLLIGGLIYWTLRSRSRSLAVYHVHPLAVEEALRETFQKWGRAVKRTGQLWSDEKPLVQLSVFHVFSHVTVRMLMTEQQEREELERSLRLSLPNKPTGENIAGPWLTTAAVSCFIMTSCCVILTLVSAFRR